MFKNIPIIVRVSVSQTKFDMDAVDAEIYCVNNTANEFYFSTQSESFITVDEEEGTTVEFGSGPLSKKLMPGEFCKITEVLGWEWDGHVGIEIAFRQEGSENVLIKQYNFKTSKSDFSIPGTDLVGRIIEPL